jgi:hypothetical protein
MATRGRRLLLRMVLLVLALDAAAIAIYSLAGLEHATSGTRTAFTVGWTLLTLAIVAPSLRAIRRARLEARRPGPRP